MISFRFHLKAILAQRLVEAQFLGVERMSTKHFHRLLFLPWQQVGLKFFCALNGPHQRSPWWLQHKKLF